MQCKLHCAIYNGEDHPIEVLARDWDEWVGWSRYRGQKNDSNREYISTMAKAKHADPVAVRWRLKSARTPRDQRRQLLKHSVGRGHHGPLHQAPPHPLRPAGAKRPPRHGNA